MHVLVWQADVMISLTSQRWLTVCGTHMLTTSEWMVCNVNIIHSRANLLQHFFVLLECIFDWKRITVNLLWHVQLFLMNLTLFTNQNGPLEELNVPFELDYKPLLYCIIILAIPISLQQRFCSRSGVVQPSQKKTHPQGFLFHISAIPAHWPNCNLFSTQSLLNIPSIVFWSCSNKKLLSWYIQISKYFSRKRNCNM